MELYEETISELENINDDKTKKIRKQHLNNIKNNGYYIVDRINLPEKTKRRLYDIGLVNGTKVKLIFCKIN